MRKLLKTSDVLAVTGLSRSTLYRWMDMGYFPKATKIGPNRNAWKEQDVQMWLDKI